MMTYLLRSLNEPNRDPSYSPEMIHRKLETSLNTATVSKISKPSTPKEGISMLENVLQKKH